MNVDLKRALDALKNRNLALPLDPNNWNEDGLTSFAEFGTHSVSISNISQEQLHKRFDELRAWMQHVSGANQLNAIYLDTTTIYTAKDLILNQSGLPNNITPATLLDLSTFVNSVVLYDRVFYLENKHIDEYEFNEALGNEPVLIPLPVKSAGESEDDDDVNSVGGLLRGLWYQTDMYVQELKDSARPIDIFFEEAQAVKKSWKTLLDFNDQPSLWFDPDREVKNTLFSSTGPDLLGQLVTVYNTAHEKGTKRHLRELGLTDELIKYIHQVIDECNYRSFFHVMVSNSLQLQYMPNSFRLPFRNYYYHRAKTVENYLVTSYIENEYQKGVSAYDLSAQGTLHLPLLLTALLKKISSLDEFFNALAEMRKKASDFRQRRAALDKELNEGNGEEVAKLIEALREDSSKLRSYFNYAPIAGGAVALLQGIQDSLTRGLLATLTILTFASQFSPEAVDKLRKKSLRRKYRFIVDMKDTASGLINAYPKIRTLWKLEGDIKETQTQEEMAAGFERLKQLAF